MIRLATFMLIVMALTGCASFYEQYQGKPNNKALARGSNGVQGASWSRRSLLDAVRVAKAECANARGTNCDIININGGLSSDELRRQISITYSSQSNSSSSDALADLAGREGLAAGALMAYLGANGVVKDNAIRILPKVESRSQTKVAVLFRTTFSIRQEVMNSLFGNQTNHYNKYIDAMLIAHPNSVTTGEVIELPFRELEDVKTSLVNITIKRAITGITTDVTGVYAVN